MYALTLIAANTMHALTFIVAYIMYALCCQYYYVCTCTCSCYVCILIHTSCVCTAIAHLAGFILYNNLFLEFSSTALNDSTVTSNPVFYKDWLPLWKENSINTTEASVVSRSACKINTPLNTQNWYQYLFRHPNQELVSYFLKGISAGFRIGVSTPAHSLN